VSSKVIVQLGSCSRSSGQQSSRHENAAISAQPASHSPTQQNETIWQTEAQQAVSSQPGVGFASQQDPAAGAPQAAPQTPQNSPASSAQISSHGKSQQNGSMAQIASQHSWSSQCGVSLAVQQSPACGSPHWAEAVEAMHKTTVTIVATERALLAGWRGLNMLHSPHP